MKQSKSQQPTPRYLNDVISSVQFKKIENFPCSKSIRGDNIITNISVSQNSSDNAISKRKDFSYMKSKNFYQKEDQDPEEIQKLFEILEKDTENPQQILQRISQSQNTLSKIQVLPPIGGLQKQNDHELVISKMKSEYARLFPSLEKTISQEQLEQTSKEQNDKKTSILNQSLCQIEKINQKEHIKLFKSIDLVNNNEFVDFKKMTEDLSKGKKIHLPQEIPHVVSGKTHKSGENSTSLLSQIKEFISQKLVSIPEVSFKKAAKKKRKFDISAPPSQRNKQLLKKQKPQYYNKWYIQPKKQFVHKLENLNNLPQQFMETPALIEVQGNFIIKIFEKDDEYFYKNIQEGKSCWKQQDPFNQVKQSDEEKIQIKLASQEIISRTKVIDDLKNVLNRKGVRVPLFLKGSDNNQF